MENTPICLILGGYNYWQKWLGFLCDSNIKHEYIELSEYEKALGLDEGDMLIKLKVSGYPYIFTDSWYEPVEALYLLSGKLFGLEYIRYKIKYNHPCDLITERERITSQEFMEIFK